MKKTLLLLGALVCFSGLVYADICSDIRQSYEDRMLVLKRDTDAALSQTTDPMEISAIRASYEMQLQQLTVEMNNVLTSEGCLTTPPPPPDPEDPPSDPEDPPADPEDPPADPEDPPAGPGDGDTCYERLKDYADELKGMGLHRHEFVARLKARASEIGCNFGSWQRCDHKNHCRHKKPKCDPKPDCRGRDDDRQYDRGHPGKNGPRKPSARHGHDRHDGKKCGR